MAEPSLVLRWSEHEARKPYARPFGVSFRDQSGGELGSIAVNGSDLLYYGQFQTAVLSLAGELFRDPRVEAAPDPQQAWLDVLAPLLPAATIASVTPCSHLDPSAGRVFSFALLPAAAEPTLIEAAQLLSYQDLQAALAHRTGRLYRVPSLEAVDDPSRRQMEWVAHLGRLVRRPEASEAMSGSWPWR